MTVRSSRFNPFLIVRGALGWERASKLVFVFQCYLDDSGTSGLPIVTMAGFVAHLNQWEVLEPAFDGILNAYDVPVLHAKEFHNTDGPFKGWTRIKKRSLAKEIFGAAHGRMKGLSLSVRRKAFLKAKIKHGLHTMSAYGNCFSGIMTHLLIAPDIGESIRSSGLGFIIESGNKNNSEIEKFFHYAQGIETFKGCLKGLSIVPKKSCRAIQVADFLAFYSRRQARNVERFDGKLVLPTEFFLDLIKQNVPTWIRIASGDSDSVGSVETFGPFKTSSASNAD